MCAGAGNRAIRREPAHLGTVRIRWHGRTGRCGGADCRRRQHRGAGLARGLLVSRADRTGGAVVRATAATGAGRRAGACTRAVRPDRHLPPGWECRHAAAGSGLVAPRSGRRADTAPGGRWRVLDGAFRAPAAHQQHAVHAACGGAGCRFRAGQPGQRDGATHQLCRAPDRAVLPYAHGRLGAACQRHNARSVGNRCVSRFRGGRAHGARTGRAPCRVRRRLAVDRRPGRHCAVASRAGLRVDAHLPVAAGLGYWPVSGGLYRAGGGGPAAVGARGCGQSHHGHAHGRDRDRRLGMDLDPAGGGCRRPGRRQRRATAFMAAFGAVYQAAALAAGAFFTLTCLRPRTWFGPART